ncbi:hypothetical protein ACROYT_G023811 [Oculina patagonica]
MATILNNTTSKGAGNYIGETKKQLRDGFGVYNYSNKFFRYEGEWSKGKKHGHGKLVMADGSFYEGQFINGEIQGHGFRRWASTRNEYTGQFVKGELNGHGIMIYGDGSRYEGEWVENRREGEGKLISTDGSIYEGSFHNHRRHGEGKLMFSNGDVYEGDWVNDLRQGHGIMKFVDGTIYGGQWWGDVFNGEGSMIHTSGVSYEGMWVNGRPEVETVEIRIVGDEHIEFMQGRPFGFEVECVTADGEPTQEEGRLLQVTAGIKVGSGRKSADGTEKELDTIMTPFGFEIEPYPLTEMLGEISSEMALQGFASQAPSVMSNRPVQASSPIGEELVKPMDNVQITDASDVGDKESSILEAHAEMPSRTAAPSQASTMMPASYDKSTSLGGDAEALMVPPVLSLPPSVSPSSTQDMAAAADSRTGNARWKGKASAALNANLLKVANRSVPSSAVSDGKKKKDALADVVEKADGKRKKDKKEEKDDKFCKPGDYVIIVEDVTSPPFLNVTLAPAFLHVKVTQKKRARSKMESRRN